jgi:RNA polymerase sigma factor (sigma-70 family)
VFDLKPDVIAPVGPTTGTEGVSLWRQRMRINNQEPDVQLVEAYRQAAAENGPHSEEASLAFEPIFRRYWPYVSNLASSRLGAVYAEDLAAESMSTVLERLNGKEVITNLRGLVRHSFEREYATLLEKLFQGKKLMRAGLTSVEAGSVGGAKVKGATMLSLNAPAANSDTEDLELIHLLDDPTADVVEAAARRELVRVLHDLIDEMPSQYRAPLVCQWLLGMRIKEVSEELNLTIDQVKHNTARGIKWLQKRMPGQPSDWML